MLFRSAFSASDKDHIVKNTTRYFGTNQYSTKDDYTVTTGGSTTEDNVWLISYYEAGNTYYGTNAYLNKKGRAATPTDFAVVNRAYINKKGCGYYWLRSAGNIDSHACYVLIDGDLDYNYVNGISFGVRPALLLSI